MDELQNQQQATMAAHHKASRRYYDDLGMGHDGLVRCKECKALNTIADFQPKGACKNCGHRKMTEITALSTWEWLKIRLGLIRFPYRKEFLREFSARG